jgi:hypothetical protein
LGAEVLEKAMMETLSGVGFMGNPSPARTCLPSLAEMARSAKAAEDKSARQQAAAKEKNLFM